jgi:phosphopentomutase
VSGRRAFVVVIDACGVGALPDAADYGDVGTNTLVHLAERVGGLKLPVLEHLGLGNITAIEGVSPATAPAVYGRLAAIGPGKDSTAGHWGLMGVRSAERLPTFPQGFPPEVLELIRAASGRGILCNRPANGITVLDDFGAEHLAGGDLILYTSADSVIQLAAHADVMGVDELYAVCERVRAGLAPEHAVGRVIARPFIGRPGGFSRTDGRHDYALSPPGRSYLDELQEAGVPVHTVGKAGALMAGVGVDVEHPGATNAVALAEMSKLVRGLQEGLVFTNLVETDQLYGHRHDAPGFAGALAEIDVHVGGWLAEMSSEDLLILTADHGVDVTAPHTDHTREYAPLLAAYAGGSGRHDGALADVGASALEWLTGRDTPELPGRSFLGTAAAPGVG